MMPTSNLDPRFTVGHVLLLSLPGFLIPAKNVNFRFLLSARQIIDRMSSVDHIRLRNDTAAPEHHRTSAEISIFVSPFEMEFLFRVFGSRVIERIFPSF
jgi:hypothetical protein